MPFRYQSMNLYEHPCEFKLRGKCTLVEGSCFLNNYWTSDQHEECPKEVALLARRENNVSRDTVQN